MKLTPRRALAIFVLGGLALCAGLAWVTWTTLRLERIEWEALHRSAFEEDIRLALWRMDAALATLVAFESSRPGDDFVAAESTPASFPADFSPLVAGRFELRPGKPAEMSPAADRPGWLSRLQEDPVLVAAAASDVEAADVEEDQPPPESRRAVEDQPPPESRRAVEEQPPEPEVQLERVPPPPDPWSFQRQEPVIRADRTEVDDSRLGRQSAVTQQVMNMTEFSQRQQLAAQSMVVDPAGVEPRVMEPTAIEPANLETTDLTPTDLELADLEPARVTPRPPSPEPPSPEPPPPEPPPQKPPSARVTSAFEARWLDGDLLLTRTVQRRGQPATQGTWLDWQRLGEWLLADSLELLPAARLVPVADPGESDPGRRLALLPLRLEVGPPSLPPSPRWSPVRRNLAAVWGASLLALTGLGAVLIGAVRLSQRRGDFVSAVTHELRTPLTTVRLYTDLLLDDMVPEGERRGYLETLKGESDRLGHLVGNVLSFARLEKTSGGRGKSTEKLGDLLDDVVPRLRERVERQGLRLTVATEDEHRETTLRADRESVGQILLNLADNACKYAGGGASDELRLETRLERGRAVIRVRDFGGGVPAKERAKLFRPFHRSAEGAADSEPGVGLGLALSRRLARQLGGDLRLAKVEPGAAFDLTLRRC